MDICSSVSCLLVLTVTLPGNDAPDFDWSPFMALEKRDALDFDFTCYEGDSPTVQKVWKAANEFHHYISVNRSFIPNYDERYRYGETISTAFVESTVNEVISRRMVKKQQMRWTKQGAHLLLQIRTQTLNDDLRDTVHRCILA